MALPSREQTFAFENCRELVQKLSREIDRYREVVGSDEEHDWDALIRVVDQLKDSAFNAAVTAWHLCDWVFNDMTAEQREKLGFKKLGDLQTYVRKHCRELHLCRQAATASKHWTVEQHPDPDVQVVVTGETGWTIYFVDQGKKIPADNVFEMALSFWIEFIYSHGIAKALDDADAEKSGSE
ncbi:hypothetical protein [Bradyrhizobium ottawaense]|uniref:hypothetical protein n=1 Tax=Bradyrhizobium ottawaense TaxID=931866 RepID=UPI001BA87CF7|nr:hypothetical protein [Bradyrhizobium ottawaense]MBR1332828.1 hypothetical protein [Bradyrhizobium ottawaense]